MDRRYFLKLLAAVPALAALPVSDLWKQVAPSGPISRWPASQDLTVGDLFTIEGVYDIHPITRETMPFLKYFVVTQDTKAGEFAPFSPTIVVNGPLANASQQPASNAAMTPAWVGMTIPTRLVFNG